MRANEKQIGGSHYKNRSYEHWDWVCDIKLHYLIACASKYVFRWREKNGVQDLRKAIHYLEKAIERNVKPTPLPWWRRYGWLNMRTWEFVEPLESSDAMAIELMAHGYYQSAIEVIKLSIISAKQIKGTKFRVRSLEPTDSRRGDAPNGGGDNTDPK